MRFPINDTSTFPLAGSNVKLDDFFGEPPLEMSAQKPLFQVSGMMLFCQQYNGMESGSQYWTPFQSYYAYGSNGNEELLGFIFWITLLIS